MTQESEKLRNDGAKLFGVLEEGENLSRIEIRFAGLEKDAERIAYLFNQSSAIEHLSGVAPKETLPGINVSLYRDRHPDLNILMATPEDVKKYYRKRPSLKLLIAESESSGVIGAITVEVPGGTGITWAGVSRLVVDENVRRKGIGKRLLRSADALILSKISEGGLEYSGAQAGIIQGVEGDNSAIKLFLNEGYTFRHHGRGNCVSWDNRTGRFVQRDTFNIGKDIKTISSFRRGEFPRYLPK